MPSWQRNKQKAAGVSEIPEDELAASRAALAATLEATAAILPWVARPATPRYPPELNQRWLAACHRLAEGWSARHQLGAANIRPAVFALYGIALESTDASLLAFGEALASCADHFEKSPPGPRLTAAFSATVECLDDPAGLEHEAFGERIRHFAQRLHSALLAPASGSPIIDRMFVEEATEQLENMREALAALPADAYTLARESAELCIRAEQLEQWQVLPAAQAIARLLRQSAKQLDQTDIHQQMSALLDTLEACLQQEDN